MKNGLTFIVRERYSLPLVAIGVMIKVGRLDESDDVLGVAELTKRMVFRGTLTRPEDKSVAASRALGGVLASETYEDRTFLGATLPAENAWQALEILADVLQHPIFDAHELKREIETTLQEERFRLDQPEAFSLQRALAAAFTEQ
ncbi:MAG: insulinase family protein, partial [candidate division WOR-3 bacterium]